MVRLHDEEVDVTVTYLHNILKKIVCFSFSMRL